MVWDSLIDRPVEKYEEDSLRLKDYANALGEFIMNCETPLTIGIQGDWGIGKTSLLNMIKNALRPRRGLTKKFPTIYFNTWQYSQFNTEEYLGIAILNGIISAIGREFPQLEEQKCDTLKEYGALALNFVTKATSQIIKQKVGVDIEAAARQEVEETPYSQMSDLIENYKQQFADLVNDIIKDDGSRLIIMIDDLDRVKPIKALELLEAMKNFLDVPKCVFVLAVDYSVIQQGVKEKFSSDTQEVHGKSYFDKIIQVPFNMPVSAYHMDKYIMSLLGWDRKGGKYKKKLGGAKHFLSIRDSGLEGDSVEFFTNMTKLTIGSNPRGIKRVVNYVNLMKIVCTQKRKGEHKIWTLPDAKILYALACMQLEWPELFNYFAENPTPTTISKLVDWDFLSKLPDLKPMFKRSHNEGQLKSNITGFFDELIAIIDTNQDGEISVNEFRPIIQMMKDANLTSATLEDTEKAWKDFRRLALKNDTKTRSKWKKDIDSVIDLFKRSKWNDPFHFKLLPAGKRFYNIFWEDNQKDNQIGSMVTTQAEPIQVFLKVSRSKFETDTRLLNYLQHYTLNHYGIGDYKMNIKGLTQLDQHEALNILNEIHDLTLQSMPESKSVETSISSTE